MFGWMLNGAMRLGGKEELGRWGERRCGKFLKNKGMKILARNFSCKTGEVDIIAVDSEGVVVFVEVKTRADESFAEAEHAIGYAKKRRLIRASRFFLAKHNIEDRPCRFDVVVIVGKGRGAEIRHYENAFVP